MDGFVHAADGVGIEDDGGGGIQRLGVLGIDTTDAFDANLGLIRLEQEIFDFLVVRDFARKLEVVDVTGVFEDSVVDVGTGVVGEQHELAVTDTEVKSRCVEEGTDVVENAGGFIDQSVDTERTCAAFGYVDGEERQSHVLMDEAVESFIGISEQRFLAGRIGDEVAEVRASATEGGVGTDPEVLDDEGIGSHRHSHGEQRSIRDGADHVGNVRDRHEARAGDGILRVHNTSITGDSEEGFEFDFTLESVGVLGSNFKAQQNADVIAIADSVRTDVTDVSTDFVDSGDDRDLETAKVFDTEVGGSTTSEGLERIDKECSHLAGERIVFFGHDDGLDDLDGSVAGFQSMYDTDDTSAGLRSCRLRWAGW